MNSKLPALKGICITLAFVVCCAGAAYAKNKQDSTPPQPVTQVQTISSPTSSPTTQTFSSVGTPLPSPAASSPTPAPKIPQSTPQPTAAPASPLLIPATPTPAPPIIIPPSPVPPIIFPPLPPVPFLVENTSASTNTPAEIFTIYSDGSATIHYIIRDQRDIDNHYQDQSAPTQTFDIGTLQNDLAQVGNLSSLQATSPCMKSASFGTVVTLQYQDQTSPDISCIEGTAINELKQELASFSQQV